MKPSIIIISCIFFGFSFNAIVFAHTDPPNKNIHGTTGVTSSGTDSNPSMMVMLSHKPSGIYIMILPEAGIQDTLKVKSIFLKL